MREQGCRGEAWTSSSGAVVSTEPQRSPLPCRPHAFLGHISCSRSAPQPARVLGGRLSPDCHTPGSFLLGLSSEVSGQEKPSQSHLPLPAAGSWEAILG